MKNQSTTLLVIGGGPGGYVAAIRAGQLGIPTVLVEGEALGGTCLNIGCIPSKALIHAADEFEKARHYANGSALGIKVQSPQIDLPQTVRWKDGIVSRLTGGVATLLRKNGVQVIKGWATIVDGKTVDVQPAAGEPVRLQCEHLLLATGSLPVELPFMPFGGNVISSTEALAPAELPRRLVVVGAGYIGLEMGIAYRKLGSEVAVVEATPRVLPAYDDELTRPVLATLKRLGVVLHLGCTVQGLDPAGAVRVRSAKADEFALPADRVLVAVGRRPRTEGFGLESLRLDLAGRAIRIDDQCRTSMRNVWAIGDVTGEPMLAHRAMAQGELVAEVIAGHKRKFAPAAIPGDLLHRSGSGGRRACRPPMPTQAGLDCITAAFPFAANGRAMTIESSEGFVRVVARRDNHLIVGWQAVGRAVSELSSAFSQSIEMGARLEDVAGTIHAHPTLGEAVQETALRALGQALHI